MMNMSLRSFIIVGQIILIMIENLIIIIKIKEIIIIIIKEKIMNLNHIL
jgi:hypothetical protein